MIEWQTEVPTDGFREDSLVVRRIILCCAATVLLSGCREPPRVSKPPTSAPAERPDSATLPTTPPKTPPSTIAATQPEATIGGRCVVLVRDVREPQTGWLVIEQIEKEDQPASAVGTVAGPRKLIVDTKNVRLIRIELAKAGVPTRRSVILRIDDQAIEITGRYGPVARFERSRQGRWYASRPPK